MDKTNLSIILIGFCINIGKRKREEERFMQLTVKRERKRVRKEHERRKKKRERGRRVMSERGRKLRDYL